jgi:hypothetical protein
VTDTLARRSAGADRGKSAENGEKNTPARRIAAAQWSGGGITRGSNRRSQIGTVTEEHTSPTSPTSQLAAAKWASERVYISCN